MLKAVQDNFKYTISLIELFYREQWTEKGFIFNIIDFLFDSVVLMLNIVSAQNRNELISLQDKFYISILSNNLNQILTMCMIHLEIIYVHHIEVVIPIVLVGRDY